MIRFLLPLLFITSASLVAAQELAPCGTVGERTAWLRQFQKGEIAHSARGADIVIHVSPHLLGNDVGEPFRLDRALGALGALEQDFQGTGIRFVAPLPFDTIYSTAYNDHETVLEGADLMFANNVAGSLNLYFLRNPAGNCGYNLPYAGIAIAFQCALASSVTIAHEVGHGLSLPHPFLGWEGGKSHDSSEPPTFQAPAPRTVTYDYTYFQDTLIRDTTIIDTALVELVARTNCRDAADGFCDTSPDYLATRWTCNQNGESPTHQLDPDGVSFTSDGSLIMGYADDACQTRFTDEQTDAMRTFATTRRASWLRTGVDSNAVVAHPQPDYIDGEVLPSEFEIPFEDVANATHYFVEVSARRSYGTITADGIVTDSSLPLDPADFVPGTTYYWHVYPFNEHSHSVGFSQSYSFTYPQSSSTVSAFRQNLPASPNPIQAGQLLSLGDRWAGANATLLDMAGRLTSLSSLTSTGEVLIPKTLAPGLYTVQVIDLAAQAGGVVRVLVQ